MMTTPVMRMIRAWRGVAAAVAVLLTVSACGTHVGASDVPVAAAQSDVTITLQWWGGDSRIKTTEEAVKAFERKYPRIHVATQYSDWTGYWDRLAVQSAGGNAPDVMQMDELYLAFYGSMGALLPLDKTARYLNLRDVDDSLLRTGQVGGVQLAAPMTTAQYGVIVNQDVLDALGLRLPDTDNWTWDEFESFAQQVYKKSGGSYIGAIAPNNGYGLQLWARQHGEALFKGDTVAISPQTLAGFLQLPLSWAESGIEGNAERWSENISSTLNDTDFGKGKQAMMITQTTQITPYAQAAGTDNMTLVPLPHMVRGDKTMYMKAGMYWVISSQSRHPAEAAMLIDFLLNDSQAGTLLGTERGIPANDTIRKSLSEHASGMDRLTLDFVDRLRPTLSAAPDITPNGAYELDTMIARYQQNVVFGKQSASDAAKSMIAELQDAIDFAS